ncbi:MAG TPA: chemotaxis protein, partial [Sphingomonas sp.]|nr:chemotaxis protein [Sphingomonas sp.]
MAAVLPPPESITKTIDLAERLRAFGLGPADVALARELWTVIEPEARTIAKVHWERRRQVYGEHQNWAPQDQEQTYELAVAYLRNRYNRVDEDAWVRSAERTVASAYAMDVGLTPILAMIDAGGRATHKVVLKAVTDREKAARFHDLLLRLGALESDIYFAIYNGYCRFSERVERDRLAVNFGEKIATMVEETSREGGALRLKASQSSASARGVLGKASEVAAAAEQSAVAMREAAQTAAGLIRAIEDARTEVEAA